MLNTTINEVIASVSLTGSISKLHANSSMSEFVILKALHVQMQFSKAPVIKEVLWQPPILNWMKCNSVGASTGNPGNSSCAGIFQNRGSDKIEEAPVETRLIDHKRRHQNDTAKMLTLISTVTKFLWVIADGLLHRQQPLPADELIIFEQPFLPDELIFEILLLLPVRSLRQFKCICKSWKTLISDPQFAKAHLRSITVNPTPIHQRLFTNDRDMPVSFPVKPLLESPSTHTKHVKFTMEYFHDLGICNGLLCLINLNFQVWLWNPSLRLQS
ncbi:unnamed protein product [Trifolium pratense]|uniref:Uncharacterized protein n=1 Tax=Trifolium pratense TaxID=57577 RepID=A0ACB0JTB0_TRIPR|nr:unnamed protein product [Trifolium pratense]